MDTRTLVRPPAVDGGQAACERRTPTRDEPPLCTGEEFRRGVTRDYLRWPQRGIINCARKMHSNKTRQTDSAICKRRGGAAVESTLFAMRTGLGIYRVRHQISFVGFLKGFLGCSTGRFSNDTAAVQPGRKKATATSKKTLTEPHEMT